MVSARHAEGWAAAVGALVGGFLVYVAVAGMGGGVDWEDRLTFDQSGELELEGVGILAGLVLGSVVGAPIGTYLSLQLFGARRAGTTALATIPTCALIAFLAFWLVPTGPADPVLTPYVVFGGWFFGTFLMRLLIAGRREPPRG